MSLLTREQILNPIGTRYDQFPVPALGGELRIRSLTDAERSEFELSGDGETREERLKDLKRRLIVSCAVDASGNTMLTAEHVDAFGAQDSAIVDFMFERCRAHVGISKEDVNELVGKPLTVSSQTVGDTPASESQNEPAAAVQKK